MKNVYLVQMNEENYGAYDDTRKLFMNKEDADAYAKKLEADCSSMDYVTVEELELN